MLPKDRESLERTHAVGASVSVGNRSARLIEHYDEWETARVTAFYIATERRYRCIVTWCKTHEQWMVWETNRTCRVRTQREVMFCKQCGLHYFQWACGPSHALQAHRLELSGIKR